jgi:uncharacterized coiled-coil protein SlyX
MPSENHPQAMSDRDRARLDRVEESLAFTERAVEQLSTEIADMNRRVQALTRRIALIEQRLEKPEGGADSSTDEDGSSSGPSGTDA